MDGRHYPSDLKDEQWQIIEPLLPPPSKVGSKRTVCRRRVFEAICYVNREGISWRALPHDFPKVDDGVLAVLGLAEFGPLAEDERRFTWRRAPRGRSQADAERRHHRQPVGEDDGNGGERRLRRGQED